MRKTEKKSKIFGKSFNYRAGHNFLIMGKIMNITWTGYNGVRVGGGGEPTEARKYFKKFVEIGNKKLINLINFQKLHQFFPRIWRNI